MRGPPQTPMSSVIGISIASQQMKKRTKSSALNTPTMADSMTSRQTRNSFTRFVMYFQEHNTHSGEIRVVSRTSSRLMPSMPRW